MVDFGEDPAGMKRQGNGFFRRRPCGDENARGVSLDPEAFEIDELHRFEGMTDPGDESIVYAISSTDGRIKGILVNAYGPDASPLTQEMVRKLGTHGRG